ncbi:MAG: CRISPR-associated endonuclease Cas2 [Ignavibacteria bacterium]|nr:CRISPR-associated endonuclease Cas2 [Ignavibacteria bacterium]
MYYIAVYDIASPKRLPRVLKVFRRYMFWIQNSSFEGEMNEGQFKQLKRELKEVIKKEEDSILFFWAEHKKYVSREIMGVEKNEITNFL